MFVYFGYLWITQLPRLPFSIYQYFPWTGIGPLLLHYGTSEDVPKSELWSWSLLLGLELPCGLFQFWDGIKCLERVQANCLVSIFPWAIKVQQSTILRSPPFYDLRAFAWDVKAFSMVFCVCIHVWIQAVCFFRNAYMYCGVFVTHLWDFQYALTSLKPWINEYLSFFLLFWPFLYTFKVNFWRHLSQGLSCSTDLKCNEVCKCKYICTRNTIKLEKKWFVNLPLNYSLIYP